MDPTLKGLVERAIYGGPLHSSSTEPVNWELSLKEYITTYENTIDASKAILGLAVRLSKEGLVDGSVPVTLLEDILDLSPIADLAKLIEFVTMQPELSKATPHTLRLCNKLLKRQPKGQYGELAGRIMLFVAKSFKVNEPSGLNPRCEFNSHTQVHIEEGNYEDYDMELITGKQGNEICYGFYYDFWNVINIFKLPQTVILGSLQTPLENIIMYFEKLPTKKCADSPFMRYLSDRSVFQTLLCNRTFRVQIAMHLLIALKYLEEHRTDKNELTFIISCINRLNGILSSLSIEYATLLNWIIDSDKVWLKWKSTRGPTFSKPATAIDTSEPVTQSPSLPTYEFLDGTDLGNAEMTRLWHSAHKSLGELSKRQVLPTPREFLSLLHEEMQPENDIEKTYRLSGNTGYVWKALRLLTKSDISSLDGLKNGGDLETLIPRIFDEDPDKYAIGMKNAVGEDIYEKIDYDIDGDEIIGDIDNDDKSVSPTDSEPGPEPNPKKIKID